MASTPKIHLPQEKQQRVLKWIEALESKMYKQGMKALRNPDGTCCCLGVACEAAIDNGLSLMRSRVDDIIRYHEPNTDPSHGDAGHLPLIVQEWYGFSDGDPSLFYDDERIVKAITANDNPDFNWSFKRIAKALRRTYIDDPVPVHFGEEPPIPT